MNLPLTRASITSAYAVSPAEANKLRKLSLVASYSIVGFIIMVTLYPSVARRTRHQAMLPCLSTVVSTAHYFILSRPGILIPCIDTPKVTYPSQAKRRRCGNAKLAPVRVIGRAAREGVHLRDAACQWFSDDIPKQVTKSPKALRKGRNKQEIRS